MGYGTATYTHVGSRITQVGDESLGTVNLLALGHEIGGPLTQTTFTFDPLHPVPTVGEPVPTGQRGQHRRQRGRGAHAHQHDDE